MKIYKCDICGRSSNNDYWLAKKDTNLLELLVTDPGGILNKLDVCGRCFDIFVANMQTVEKEIISNMQKPKFKRKVSIEAKKESFLKLLWRDIKGTRHFMMRKKI